MHIKKIGAKTRQMISSILPKGKIISGIRSIGERKYINAIGIIIFERNETRRSKRRRIVSLGNFVYGSKRNIENNYGFTKCSFSLIWNIIQVRHSVHIILNLNEST